MSLLSPQMSLLVQPGKLPAALVHVEQRQLLLYRFRTRLVHLLDDLEGQNDVADFAGLAVPDQFDLALVIEEQKAVLVGQRLVGFEEADDVLLFSGR